MNRNEFGNLVEELRKEIDLSREQLAELMQLSGTTLIRDIEIGKRKHLSNEELLALADALRLTTRERKEFFFASINLEATNVQRVDIAQETILARIIAHLDGAQFPYMIMDKYHYILATNSLVLELFCVTRDQLTQMFDSPILRYNLIAILFSDMIQRHVRTLQMNFFEHVAVRSLQVFRANSLAFRFRDEYMLLAKELQKFPFYKAHWEQAMIEDRDEFASQNRYHWTHPTYGPLQFLSLLSSTTTSFGDLNLVTYLPMNAATDDAFKQMAGDPKARTIHLSHWRP